MEVARLDGSAGEAAGHGGGEGGELVLHGFEALSVTEETGVSPHVVAEVFDPALGVGIGGFALG